MESLQRRPSYVVKPEPSHDLRFYAAKAQETLDEIEQYKKQIEEMKKSIVAVKPVPKNYYVERIQQRRARVERLKKEQEEAILQMQEALMDRLQAEDNENKKALLQKIAQDEAKRVENANPATVEVLGQVAVEASADAITSMFVAGVATPDKKEETKDDTKKKVAAMVIASLLIGGAFVAPAALLAMAGATMTNIVWTHLVSWVMEKIGWNKVGGKVGEWIHNYLKEKETFKQPVIPEEMQKKVREYLQNEKLDEWMQMTRAQLIANLGKSAVNMAGKMVVSQGLNLAYKAYELGWQGTVAALSNAQSMLFETVVDPQVTLQAPEVKFPTQTTTTTLKTIFEQPKSMLNQSTAYDDPLNFKERFYDDHPEWKFMQYKGWRMNALGLNYVTGGLTNVLKYYNRAKQGLQVGTYGSYIYNMGNTGLATDTGFNVLNMAKQAEDYIGLDNIEKQMGFSVEEAIITSAGYNPFADRADVVDKVFFGDGISNFVKNKFGSSLGSGFFHMFGSD